jgi:hypothetical protein
MKINPTLKRYYDISHECDNDCNKNCVFCSKEKTKKGKIIKCYNDHPNGYLPRKGCNLWKHKNTKLVINTFPKNVEFQMFMDEFSKIE